VSDRRRRFPSSVPASVERYELGPVLGQGGTGRVVRARDRILRRTVALKIVRPELAAKASVREAFDAEIRLAARLRHPHLLPVLDLGTLGDGTPFLAMPLAEGPLERAPAAGWSAVVRDLLDVLAALAALHARGILHRDLKPDNVLRLGGRAVVADLGLAELGDTLGRRLRDRSGTPEFMAPEQRDGRTREFGPALDLFAFGRIARWLAADLAVPDGLPILLDALAEPDPHLRPSVAADVAGALRSLGPPTRPLAASAAALGSATWTDEVEAVPAATAPPPRRSRPASALPAATRTTELRVHPRLAVLQDPPLVGRDDALRALDRVLAAAREGGRATGVLVIGDAGVGKTRLVDHWLHGLEEAGAATAVRVTYGAAPRPDDGVAGTMRRLLRAWPGEAAETAAARLRRWFVGEGLAGPSDALLAWASGASADAGPARRAFRRWLSARAARRPVVVWLEDAAHAGPSEGLSLARAWLDDPEAPPITVVATSRSPEPPGLAGFCAAGGDVFPLAPLDRDQTRAVLDGWLRLDPVVSNHLATACAGNPLLLRHLLTDQAEAGGLVDEGGLSFTWRQGTHDVRLPADTRALLGEQLAHAISRSPRPDATRGAIDRLALAGPPTVPRSLFDALAGDEGPLLLASRLLVRDESGVGWSSPLLAEVARERAGAGTPEIWRRIAAAWAGTDHPDRPLWEGWAWWSAGDAAAAVGPLVHGVSILAQQHRVRDLRTFAPAAVAAADAAGGVEDRLRARARQAVGAWFAQRTDEALRAVDEGLALGGPGALRRELHWVRGEVLLAGRDVTGAASHLDRVAAEVPFDFREWMQLGRLRQMQGDAPGARAAWREALQAAGDEPRLRSNVWIRLIPVSDEEEVDGLLDRALEAADAAGGASTIGRVLQARAWRRAQRGDLAGAEVDLDAAIRGQLEEGALSDIAALRATRAELLRRKGDLDGAREVLTTYLAWTVESGRASETLSTRLNLGALAAEAGDVACVEQHLAAFREAWRGPPGDVLGGRAVALAVWLAAERDDRQAAEEALVEPFVEPDERWRAFGAVVRDRLIRRGWPDLAVRIR
jgi:hypothetical protein